jgi:urease accessory protein
MPQVAAAHSGDMHDLLAGIMHPLTGADHLAAMLSLGCWAAVRRDGARWVLPVAVLASTAVGGYAALLSPALQSADVAAVLSVIVLGLLLSVRARPQAAVALVIAGCVGAVHGYAHAAQIPAKAALLTITGFLVTSSLLQLAGLLLCKSMLRHDLQPLLRAAGACIAIGGAIALATA